MYKYMPRRTQLLTKQVPEHTLRVYQPLPYKQLTYTVGEHTVRGLTHRHAENVQMTYLYLRHKQPTVSYRL